MTIGVAVLGAGYMARQHVRGYQRLPQLCSVRIVVSRSADRARALASALGADHATTVEAALRRPDVDAVDICLPSYLHASTAIAAFESGRHVLVQKPLALSLEDAGAIWEAARRAGRLLMVATTLRFSPQCEAIEGVVSSGEVGDVISFFAERLSPPVNWNTWMADESLSGGTPVDLMIHDLDLVEGFLGPARTVMARAPGAAESAVGWTTCLIDCERGTANVTGSMSMPPTFPFSSTARVVGTKGAAEFRYRDAGGVEGGNVSRAAVAPVVEVWGPNGEMRLEPHATNDPWEREVAHFIECVADGRSQPLVGSFHQSRRALALSLAVRKAVASGRLEEVPS